MSSSEHNKLGVGLVYGGLEDEIINLKGAANSLYPKVVDFPNHLLKLFELVLRVSYE